MDLHHHPELLDRLAAAYAVGTLRGGARRRLETLARRQPEVQAACLRWQARLAGLTELQTPVAPPPYVWTRIANLLPAATLRPSRPAGGPRPWWQSLPLWRTTTVLGALATVSAVVVGLRMHDTLEQQSRAEVAELRAQLQAQPQIRYVAVLVDQAAAASMLVTFDAEGQRLELQRLGGYQEGGDKSLQLWALPPGARPRSLGVLGADRRVRLTAGEAELREVPTLAISLEPLGGVPGEGGPTGPVLFTGPLVQRML